MCLWIAKISLRGSKKLPVYLCVWPFIRPIKAPVRNFQPVVIHMEVNREISLELQKQMGMLESRLIISVSVSDVNHQIKVPHSSFKQQQFGK